MAKTTQQKKAIKVPPRGPLPTEAIEQAKPASAATPVEGAKPTPLHFEISFEDTAELASVIKETVTQKYVQELLFLVINRTFKPVLPRTEGKK